jgi:tryptophan 2,3-dioxygenase
VSQPDGPGGGPIRAEPEVTGPKLAFGGTTPYAEYGRVEELLSLQHPRTDAPAEMTFYVMGQQVNELMFKLLYVELDRARALIRAGDVAGSVWVLRRVASVQRAHLGTWEVLSTLTPNEYNAFRDSLGDASGFQSYGYRKLEFILGNKVPEMARPYRRQPNVYPEVVEALHSPSLYDEVIGLLKRRGADIPDEVSSRTDFSQPYRAHEAVEAAWRRVYAAPDGHRELHLLGESLMDVAFQFSRWRYTHLLTVERLLGTKPGTGGTSSGVGWLQRIADHRFFPELWSVRTTL